MIDIGKGILLEACFNLQTARTYPKLILCFIFLTFGNASWAGEPIESFAVCPVGGETFSIAGTTSCTTFPPRTMSFRQESSCDWITKLPVCPTNGLPIYKDFTPKQIMELTSFIETAEYSAVRELPPWQRAYAISKHLGESGSPIAFDLLLNALWYETMSFLESKAGIDQLLFEAEAELARAPAADRPFLNAILAYWLALAGRLEESDKQLDLAKKASDIPDHLMKYITAIEFCQADMTSEKCGPNTPIIP